MSNLTLFKDHRSFYADSREANTALKAAREDFQERLMGTTAFYFVIGKEEPGWTARTMSGVTGRDLWVSEGSNNG